MIAATVVSVHDAYRCFCELIVQRGGSAGHPDPTVTWEAFLEFVEVPVCIGDPPGPVDADIAPVDLLVENDEVEIGFSRNMYRPWSEEHSGEPITVGASFRYARTPQDPAVEPLALSGIGGPAEATAGPLRRPGAGRPSIAPGRLREAVDEHPDFTRVLGSRAPVSAFVYVDDPSEAGA